MNSSEEGKANRNTDISISSLTLQSQPYAAVSLATLAAGLLQVHGPMEKPRPHAKCQPCFKGLSHILSLFHHH